MSQQQGAQETLDLDRHLEKMVTLQTYTDEEDLIAKAKVLSTEGEKTLVEVTGRITAVNPNGKVYLFKPRSQRSTHMMESVDLVSVKLAGSATLRPVGQKALRPLTVNNARRHLADFHAWELGTLNTMSDELALEEHAKLDHTELGHNHTLAENGANSKASPDTSRTRAEMLAKIASA